jgi:hypothetical protein
VRERLTTLACALGALLLFATLFLRRDSIGDEPVVAPNTQERGGNGLLAARNWLEAEGVRSLSLRERFGTLVNRPDLPRAGNLLITTTPTETAFRPSETKALESWLRAGNTLLVLAALSDRPDWGRGGGFAHSDITALTGLDTAAGAQADDSAKPDKSAAQDPPAPGSVALQAPSRLPEPLRSTLVANRPHAYLQGVRSAVALSDSTPQPWDVKLPHGGFMLALAHQQESGQSVLWVRPMGAGTIILSAFGGLFSNRALALADNAQLLANIVASSVVPGGAVLFDDEHQGLASAYDPAKFYRDPRLYETLAVLLVAWLVWVLGSTRLHLPPRRAAAPREAELVRATGLFLARVLRPAAAARRMFENFFARVQLLTHRAGDGGPPWEWLENHPRLVAADVQQLRGWYTAAYSEQRVPLERLHNLIIRTERQLAA